MTGPVMKDRIQQYLNHLRDERGLECLLVAAEHDRAEPLLDLRSGVVELSLGLVRVGVFSADADAA